MSGSGSDKPPGERYRAWTKVKAALLEAASGRIPLVSLATQARALTLWSGNRVTPGTEGQLHLVFDMGVFAPRGDHMRAIDRLASAAPPAPDTAEATMLAALQAARFAFFRINGPHVRGGMEVTLLGPQEDVWLMDDGLAQRTAAWPGMIYAGHLCKPDEFYMTCGAVVPVDARVLEKVLLGTTPDIGPVAPVPSVNPRDPKMLAMLEEAASMPRLASLLADPTIVAQTYRAAVDCGLVGPIPGRTQMPTRH